MILSEYHLFGLVAGLCTFLVIGMFHPIVIKGHYYFGLGCRKWFLVAGILFGWLSWYVDDLLLSTVFGVVAFSSLWSIKEVTEQEERVAKGWFPANPKRKGTRTEPDTEEKD